MNRALVRSRLRSRPRPCQLVEEKYIRKEAERTLLEVLIQHSPVQENHYLSQTDLERRVPVSQIYGKLYGPEISDLLAPLVDAGMVRIAVIDGPFGKGGTTGYAVLPATVSDVRARIEELRNESSVLYQQIRSSSP